MQEEQLLDPDIPVQILLQLLPNCVTLEKLLKHTEP